MPTIKGADTEYRTVHPFTSSSSVLDWYQHGFGAGLGNDSIFVVVDPFFENGSRYSTSNAIHIAYLFLQRFLGCMGLWRLTGRENLMEKVRNYTRVPQCIPPTRRWSNGRKQLQYVKNPFSNPLKNRPLINSPLIILIREKHFLSGDASR